MKIRMTFDRLILALSLGLLATFVTSCARPGPVAPVVKGEPADCVWPDARDQVAPTWVCDQPYKNYKYTAVGSDDASDKGHARDMAVVDARNNLAATMRTYVKRLTKRYIESTGSKDSETEDKVTTDVSKQVTAEMLYGTRPVGSLTSPKGRVYVIVAMEDPADGMKAVSDAVKTSYRSRSADWQRVLQGKSEEQLDKEIRDMMDKEQEIVTPRTQR